MPMNRCGDFLWAFCEMGHATFWFVQAMVCGSVCFTQQYGRDKAHAFVAERARGRERETEKEREGMEFECDEITKR